ncbi:MAG: PKD domain-containing protein [Candidatus Lutacidiplasmatales archaeon]
MNWAQYMGSPEHTAANPWERTIAPSNVSNLTQVWKYAVNGSVNSAPIVVNGTVYFGSWAGFEYAIHAANGTLEWAKYLNSSTYCSVGGIESTPAYSNGSLYLGAPNGTWVALNAFNGSIEWSYLAGSDANGYYDWASALVFGHSVYIGTASCFDSPLIPGTIIQVNLTGNHTANHTWHPLSAGKVGTTMWTTSTADPGANTVWVTTGNDDGNAQKYAQSVVALNASTLAVRGFWQVPNVVGFDSDFGSTATLVNPAHGPPLIVATNKNGVTYAFNRSNVTLSNWSPIWTLNTGGGFSGGAFDGTTLYCGGLGGTLYAVDPSNGSVEWHTNLAGGAIYASLTEANGVVYAGAGSTEYAVDAANGTVLWSVSPPGANIDGESVVADGRLYVPTGDSSGGGHIYAYGLPFAIGVNATVPNASSAPHVAEFRGTATGGMTPYSFSWMFDDGGNAMGPTVNHSFANPGNHTGVLTVIDASGAALQTNVTVLTTGTTAVLQTAIGPSGLFGEAPYSVWLNGTEVNGSGAPYGWAWNFGDGTTGAGASVQHTYTVGGTFLISLNLSEANGSNASASVVVHVLPSLSATITASPLSGTLPVLTAFSAQPSGGEPPYTVVWSFGDGSTGASGGYVNHTYQATGNFTANATVTDVLGFQVVRSVVIEATSTPPGNSGTPLAAHPYSTILATSCNPDTAQVEFFANASGGVAPLKETWSFGDGSASGTGASVIHVFAAGSTYDTSVTVTDSNGSSAIGLVTVTVAHANCTTPVATTTSLPLTEVALALVAGLLLVIALAVLLLRRRKHP